MPAGARVPLGEAQRDDTPHRVADDAYRLVEDGRDRVGEAGERGRGQRRRAAVPGQVRRDQVTAREAGGHVREVPGGAAEAVQQQDRRALSRPGEDTEAGAAHVVEPLLEAAEKIGRIRHADGLS
jgi:hypothetical protein